MFAADHHAVDSGQSLFISRVDCCCNTVWLCVVYLEHVWWRGEMQTGLWRLDLKARNHMEDLSGDRNVIQKCILQQLDWGGGALSELICLRLGAVGGSL